MKNQCYSLKAKSLDYITRLKAASSGLKKGMENDIFWSEIGSGF